MSEMAVVEKRILLSPERAYQLSRLAQTKAVSEDKIVERALDILFSVTDLLDEQTERQGWSFVSENSLRRVWDNEILSDWRSAGLRYPSALKPVLFPLTLPLCFTALVPLSLQISTQSCNDCVARWNCELAQSHHTNLSSSSP